ncbi:MAG: RICIN domain-containing protein [Bacteroidales bacterium]|nr:RICIN domain-containing protein [Bacteroidales bacterium]
MYNISFHRAFTILAALIAVCVYTNAQTPAFPGAEGFGKYTTGGRGGTVYHVTNLNDSGEGSFRDAVSQPNRIVVFDVGGVINITSRIVIQKNITIAGQTAPGEGITIYGNGIALNDQSGNTIIRYIRFRMGKNGDYRKDALGISDGQGYMFDHVSVSWGWDGTVDINGSNIDSITFQDCIIGQGIDIVGHSTGGLFQSGKWSVIRSLFIDNVTRNPKAKGTHEFINSVLYNWMENGFIMGGDSEGQSYCNMLGNYFIYGPSSLSNTHFTGANANYHIYGNDNWVDANKDGVLNGSLITNYTSATVVASPYNYPGVDSLYSAQNAITYVINNVGPSIARDSVDKLLVGQLASYGTAGQIIVDEEDNGISRNVGRVGTGIPPVDTDRDGMPDAWEIVHGLNPNSAADGNGDADSDGYTNVEEYLNHIVDYRMGGTYNLINRHSSKFLEILDSSSLADGSVVQDTADYTENQLWTLVSIDTTYFVIINVHSGLAMNVEGSSLSDGAYIIQNPFTGGDNQLWKVADLGNNYFNIINKGSGKALDIEGQATTNEAKIIQNTLSIDNSQQFILEYYIDTNLPPEVVITAPASGSIYNAGDSVIITATATDDVSVSKLEFYLNSTILGEDDTAPYSYQIDSIIEGNHDIYVKAIDEKGLESYDRISILVLGAADSGVVNILIQENDSAFCGLDGTIDTDHEGYTGTGFCNSTNAVGAGIDYKIYVSEKDTVIIVIRYAEGSQNRSAMLVSSYEPVNSYISLPASGSYDTWILASAEAILDTGYNYLRLQASTENGLPNIDYIILRGKGIRSEDCAGDINDAPIVSIISPSPDSIFYIGDTVTIEANASDPDGISKVKFFINEDKIGEDGSAPYSVTIDSFPKGNYTAYAVAFDSYGKPGKSSSVMFFVLEAGDVAIIIQEDDISFCSVDSGGTIIPDNPGYTGSGFINTENAIGEGCDWLIDVSEKDSFLLEIRYALASGDRPGNFLVDGVIVTPNISLPSTGSWSTWEITSAIVPMDTGIHNIRMEATTSGGLANIDYIQFTGKEISMVNCHPIPPHVSDYTAGSDILIYPNPAGQFVNIVLPENIHQNNIIYIYDLTGELVFSNKLPVGINHIICTESLANGMYIIQVVNNKQVFTKQLVIRK